ncbi:Nucleolar Complex 2 protein, partial [Teratosphaeriaceae sp. CCFEE 6253]
MKNSAAELWGLCAAGGDGVAYTTAFTFLRQLAVHLRASITQNGNDSYKTVYNWQYTHSLDFWSRVLALYARDAASALRPLIYPLVQVTLGALRLIPTATYFPLRFQLIRSLLRISGATATYIPLAPALYEVLASAEMRKAPKPATLKPLDFAVAVRAPKAYLRTRVYQDGVGEQVVELLGEFLGLWGTSVAFPELSLPVIVLLKRWLKEVNSRVGGKGNKNAKVNAAVQVLVQRVEANG